MVILRSLKTVARTLITSSSSTTTTLTTLFPFSQLHNPLRRHHGPLFLTCPPWKLSQSAPPLYLHPNAIVFRKVNAINLNLLRATTTRLPLHSNSNHSPLLRTFLNVPNLISFSRLISAPLLGWMITNVYFCDAGLAGLVFRDVFLVRGAVFERASSLSWKWKSWSEFFNLDGTHCQKVEPLYISKVNTVFQLGLVAATLLQPEFGTQETQSYITYLSWLVTSTTMASSAAYAVRKCVKVSLVDVPLNQVQRSMLKWSFELHFNWQETKFKQADMCLGGLLQV
ncbi:hypothetical protein VNO77_01719 [Canavalia gladiata]|uniref:Uncharacterized protein n=1 Tax=Canavalia gladiata TaxID=3824 RepID=A0AAN9MWL4_CANGL